jgi:hypothetical protein
MRHISQTPVWIAALSFSALYSVQAAVAQPALPELSEALGGLGNGGGAADMLPAGEMPLEANGELDPLPPEGGDDDGELPGLEGVSATLSGEVTGPESVDFEVHAGTELQSVTITGMRLIGINALQIAMDNVPDPEEAAEDMAATLEGLPEEMQEQDPEALAEALNGNGNGNGPEQALEELEEQDPEALTEALEESADPQALEEQADPDALAEAFEGNGNGAEEDFAPEDFAVHLSAVLSGPEEVGVDLTLGMEEQELTVNGEPTLPPEGNGESPGLDELSVEDAF